MKDTLQTMNDIAKYNLTPDDLTKASNVVSKISEYYKEHIHSTVMDELFEAGVIDDLTRELREMFEEEREPGQTFSDWIKTKSVEDLKRIELNDGGKVVDFISYAKSKKPKIKKINLAQGDFDKKVSDLTESDKDLVKELLRKSGVLVGD